ncbi:dTDP-4-dehydrorhamnose 3,5-epimerase family protein [Halothiobacillus diazotrophicus]|uniref:dTDP-4-dehydrorhamnose 3,5-epimerase family protein n=1 Tax=Halothiobacillus diazotrophicus TaxID=1860122 RepID=UPI0009EE8F2D|nr:dTDP-4-dehydrorhamnose 3,5-epimerase family protein [Halothiobacillus diazotrophicus]
MSRFTIFETPLPDLKLIQRHPVRDTRGVFTKFYSHEELATVGCQKGIAQINHSHTIKAGTVRGLHFQTEPYSEYKLVSCLHGTIWDIAVDIRPESASFLQWFATELSAENCMALCIPPGFAHGFQTLTDHCELLYAHSAPYRSDAESGINPKDPTLNIPWPRPIELLSTRDQSLPTTNDWIMEMSS